MRRDLVWIFAAALSIRAAVAILQIRFGIYSGIDFDQQIYGTFSPGLELYHDFYYFYAKQLADLASGLTPYSGFSNSYTPLFLYSMLPFFMFVNVQSASIPILVADAATAPMIYLIVTRIATRRLAAIAGAAYAFAPFAVLYEGYLWFSSQPMTFFIVISLYFYVGKKPVYSVAMLAIAVMFKQEALFVLPAYLIWYIWEYRGYAIKGILVFCSILLIISLPFLAIAPSAYIGTLTYGVIDNTNIPPLYGSPINNSVSRTGVTVQPATLDCSSFSNNSRNLICNFGNLTYTDIASGVPWTLLFSGVFLDTIAPIIALALFAVLPYFLFLQRRKPETLFLSAVYSSMAILALFSTFHPLYRYYILPDYAMILCAVTSRRTAIPAILAPIASLLLPSGMFQLLLPLFGTLIMVINGSEKKIGLLENEIAMVENRTLP